MKKLVVSNYPLCSRPISTPIMDAMIDLEELSINSGTWNEENATKGCFDLQKDFTKLRRLDFGNHVGSSGILDKIPDDMLEALTVGNMEKSTPDEERLQDFLNRQKLLKKLKVNSEIKLELSQQDLEELKLTVPGEDKAMAAVLKHQPNLRFLESFNFIGSVSLEELQKMRRFEVLHAIFTGQLRGELTNLKELKIYDDCSIFQGVAFPKLTKLEVKDEDFIDENYEPAPALLEPEYILALSCSATNLQQISIESHRIDFLPVILENFTKLVHLKVESSADGDLNFQPPSRPNSSLKELIIEKYRNETPDSAIYQTIALCPNLERIFLWHVAFTEHEILNLIQSHSRLTHFRFDNGESPLLFYVHDSDFLGTDMDPTLVAIINIFKNSQNFISLVFCPIAYWNGQLYQDVLAGDAERIEVTKCNWVTWKENSLVLAKKVHDPFKFCNWF